jgi:hypothetical protein
MDAETMTPLFVFLMSRSQLQRPHACLAYLANFAVSRSKYGRNCCVVCCRICTARHLFTLHCYVHGPLHPFVGG